MKYVLDTSAVLAADSPAIEGEVAISAVTLAALHFGVLVTPDPVVRAERLRRLSVVQSLFQPLPVDDAVAHAYGRLAAAIVAAGRQPRARMMDLLIAATAVAHGQHSSRPIPGIYEGCPSCCRSSRPEARPPARAGWNRNCDALVITDHRRSAAPPERTCGSHGEDAGPALTSQASDVAPPEAAAGGRIRLRIPPAH